MNEIAVIGGGAAGMMAAVTAAEAGARVTLLERNEKLGKKVYITGKGRCNLTNACGQPTRRQTALIPQAAGKYVALSRCQQHGLMFVKVRFSQLPDGQKGMHLSVLPANRQTRAYVHTKELQYQYRLKRGDFENVDVEDLSQAYLSNMPFEDA